MPNESTCELKIKGLREVITLEQALRLDKDRIKRCPECHGRVRAHGVGKSGTAHFEHFENNPGCSLGYNFDGIKRRHRRRLEWSPPALPDVSKQYGLLEKSHCPAPRSPYRRRQGRSGGGEVEWTMQSSLKEEKRQLLEQWKKRFQRNPDWISNELPQIQRIFAASNGDLRAQASLGSYLRQLHDKLGFKAKGSPSDGGLCAGAIFRTDAFVSTSQRAGSKKASQFTSNIRSRLQSSESKS